MQVNKIQSIYGHQAPIYALQKHSNGFFSADTNGMIVSWEWENLQTGRLLAKLQSSVYALLHENDFLFVGQNFEGVHLLDLAVKQNLASSQMTKAAIFDLKTTEKYLWVAAADGRLSILDKKDLSTYRHLHFSDKSVRALAPHPHKNQMAAAYSDNFIRVFDTQNFELLYAWQAHQLSVFSLVYSPCGNYLLSGSRDAHLKIWHTENYSLKESIVAHLFTINHISFSPNAKLFATCSKDKSIKIWQTDNFRLLKVIDKGRHAGHGTSVNKIIWLSDTQLLSCSDDQSISHWQIS